MRLPHRPERDERKPDFFDPNPMKSTFQMLQFIEQEKNDFAYCILKKTEKETRKLLKESLCSVKIFSRRQNFFITQEYCKMRY